MKIEEIAEFLVTPRSKKLLSPVSQDSIDGIGNLVPIATHGITAEPVGVTPCLLQTEDQSEIYPVIDGFPVLIAPELLVEKNKQDQHDSIDLLDPRYAEAYEEMKVYNELCEKMIERAENNDSADIDKIMGNLRPNCSCDKTNFPHPENIWVDAKHDSLSQFEAYRYLNPIQDSVFVQLGGSGSHAVKALLAGASKAILLTPMVGEAKVAMHLAKEYGVEKNFGCVIAIGEELPFKNDIVDLVYSGGCFHHMRLDYAAIELDRVLKTGGKFSGVDPWKTPLHTIGTNLIGKREKSVFCKPITPERLSQLQNVFKEITVIRHGPILRYVFLALEKLGIDPSIETMFRIGRVDDQIGKYLFLKKFGGSLMVAGMKSSK